MSGSTFFRTVVPYLSAAAAVVAVVMLIFTVYFTQANILWVAFLMGVLVAAILAEIIRSTPTQWQMMRRSLKLSAMKQKLVRETDLRKNAEARIAADKSLLRLLDEEILTMVVLVDTDGNCKYHNRAFQEWLSLRSEKIDGFALRKVLGVRAYEEMEPYILKSLKGETIQYSRTLTMQEGSVYNLLVKHIPQTGETEKVTGFYILADDITKRSDVIAEHKADKLVSDSQTMPDVSVAAPNDHRKNQDLFIDSMYEQMTGQRDSGEWIVEAIEKGEFRLLRQLIAPLAAGSTEARHYEILIRLMEESEGAMPPGAFFPLAEKYGLMPFLDRWVVKHVLQLVQSKHQQGILDDGSMLFINLARATICDVEFPDFVQKTLQEYGVSSSVLCFEVPYSDLSTNGADVVRFIQAIRSLGCRAALSGFGRDMVSFNLIRGFQIEFLKIDGSIILNIHQDSVDLAKAIAINRVAKNIGVKTIAEFVENEATIAKLREIGVDFSQGFAISRPCPFDLGASENKDRQG